MPIDEDGNRADIVLDDASTISRMNLGRLYEHYLGAAARDITKEVRRQLGIADVTISEGFLSGMDPAALQVAYSFLMGFYQIVCTKQYEFFNNQITEDEKLEHLLDTINDGVYIYFPIENDKDSPDIVKAIEAYHRPTYGKISYVGNSGKRSISNRNVRIAPLYMMLLEKIADDWSSVSSGKLHHFGVLAPMTKSEKYSYPFRQSPVRTIGETEARIYAGYCGREAIAESMDRSNNPLAQRNAIWNILNSDKPTDIDVIVNRDYIKLGGNKPLQLVKHVLLAAGISVAYEPEDK